VDPVLSSFLNLNNRRGPSIRPILATCALCPASVAAWHAHPLFLAAGRWHGCCRLTRASPYSSIGLTLKAWLPTPRHLACYCPARTDPGPLQLFCNRREGTVASNSTRLFSIVRSRFIQIQCTVSLFEKYHPWYCSNYCGDGLYRSSTFAPQMANAEDPDPHGPLCAARYTSPRRVAVVCTCLKHSNNGASAAETKRPPYTTQLHRLSYHRGDWATFFCFWPLSSPTELCYQPASPFLLFGQRTKKMCTNPRKLLVLTFPACEVVCLPNFEFAPFRHSSDPSSVSRWAAWHITLTHQFPFPVTGEAKPDAVVHRGNHLIVGSSTPTPSASPLSTMSCRDVKWSSLPLKATPTPPLDLVPSRNFATPPLLAVGLLQWGNFDVNHLPALPSSPSSFCTEPHREEQSGAMLRWAHAAATTVATTHRPLAGPRRPTGPVERVQQLGLQLDLGPRSGQSMLDPVWPPWCDTYTMRIDWLIQISRL
jgi:hypothetical protein